MAKRNTKNQKKKSNAAKKKALIASLNEKISLPKYEIDQTAESVTSPASIAPQSPTSIPSDVVEQCNNTEAAETLKYVVAPPTATNDSNFSETFQNMEDLSVKELLFKIIHHVDDGFTQINSRLTGMDGRITDVNHNLKTLDDRIIHLETSSSSTAKSVAEEVVKDFSQSKEIYNNALIYVTDVSKKMCRALNKLEKKNKLYETLQKRTGLRGNDLNILVEELNVMRKLSERLRPPRNQICHVPETLDDVPHTVFEESLRLLVDSRHLNDVERRVFPLPAPLTKME